MPLGQDDVTCAGDPSGPGAAEEHDIEAGGLVYGDPRADALE
jgi:hypothetical protein